MTDKHEERQRAFTGLLAHPVLDRHANPELWPAVREHRSTLSEWFATRLGYRLVVTDSAARLFRLPLDGTVTAPRRFRTPSRRVLVLAILAAAAAEDADEVTTTQDLSDRVRALTQHEEVELAAYDPDRFTERLLFSKSVQVLVTTGALRPTAAGAEDAREGWAYRRDSIGGAYEVRRDLLLRMVDPACLQAALADSGGEEALPESAARFGIMRRLLELPVCLYEDLTDAERAYLNSQRHRLLAWCAEMTGWAVEQRAEGIALVCTQEEHTDLAFPRLRAVDFVTLMVLDELLRTQGTGSTFGPEVLWQAGAEVRARFPKALTNDLRAQDAVERSAIDMLLALDLARPAGHESWRLTPAAARFRSPEVVSVTSRIDLET